MLSVHLESGRLEVRRQSLPKISQGFARIRLLAGGICSTDLELQRGYYGFSGTPGHEFVGEVVETAGVEGEHWIGKRVAGEINLACGRCEWCARGLGRHCPRRTVLGIVKHPGAFREFLTLPVRNLHRVPDSLSMKEAVFIEPVAAACEILDQIKIAGGARIAVLGDGKLGLLVAQVLQARGARVHLLGRHREKMRLVEAAGITTELLPKKLPPAAWPIVVDATGSAEGLRTAIAICEPRGTVVMKSTIHGLVPVDTAPAIVNEITLVGSRCGQFEPAIRLLASGKVRVDRLISDEFPLQRAPEAFARAAIKGVLKVLLNPPG
ncbi:MAG TPA: alcohol dehydrogenase catalytic domain-containing protein [Bryobacteraceae bacterium]|nr:alcohol dehydrogenase catalytic domain-containing protein [Bryobacteraceae bacterium]